MAPGCYRSARFRRSEFGISREEVSRNGVSPGNSEGVTERGLWGRGNDLKGATINGLELKAEQEYPYHGGNSGIGLAAGAGNSDKGGGAAVGPFCGLKISGDEATGRRAQSREVLAVRGRKSAISRTSTPVRPRSSGEFGALWTVFFVNAVTGEFLRSKEVTEQSFDKVITRSISKKGFTSRN